MVKDTIQNMVGFVQLLVPLLITLMIATGSIISANVIQPVILFMINVISNLFQTIVIPIILVSTAIAVISKVSERVQVDKVAKFMRSGSIWVIGVLLTIFVGVLSVEGTLSSSVDGITAKATKAAVSNFIPVVGKILLDDTLSIEEGARIAVVSKSKKGEFWNKVKEGMEAAVKDVNEAYGFKKDKQITMTFEGPDDEEDVESQINTLDAVIAENPSVVCLSAGDMDSCQAQLEAAKENGIPVVAFDSNVSDTKLVRAFRGTDNTQIGKYAAYKLGSAIGKMGNVAVFSAQEKTQSAQERVKGFLDNIANYTDIKVVETVYSDQVDDMKEAMKEVLDKYPALDGVFCTNAEVSEMFLEVNKDTGENKVAMVGVDATSKQQEAIQKGEELGVLSQNPYAMGYQTMWAAIQSTAPKKETKIDKKVLLDPIWIDAENIKSEDIANYLYN